MVYIFVFGLILYRNNWCAYPAKFDYRFYVHRINVEFCEFVVGRIFQNAPGLYKCVQLCHGLKCADIRFLYNDRCSSRGKCGPGDHCNAI